ncbi:GNAT family N-acetyltransferase [Thalassotalea nanhaiensis]|uniref:GNAT family N-acetyltransferase n=1 Tax=Thalassotalea nanhaiensis TaxID=3065648 RepID=A0ABY9TGC4_9GAMM|nr:GNAT family N-acetyltransferase [Colwelliaceae bacterium SQ345]
MSITIRAAHINDTTPAINYIFSSGPLAFNYVFTQPLKFLKESFLRGRSQFGFQNHHVAIFNEQVVASIACFDRNEALSMEIGCILDMLKFYRWHFPAAAFRGLRFERIVPKPVRHSLYIAHLGVAEQYQGQGIGKQLISWAIEKARKQGYQSVTLDVAKSNIQAEKLYLSLGFEQIAYRKSSITGISDHATLIYNLR